MNLDFDQNSLPDIISGTERSPGGIVQDLPPKIYETYEQQIEAELEQELEALARKVGTSLPQIVVRKAEDTLRAHHSLESVP